MKLLLQLSIVLLITIVKVDLASAQCDCSIKQMITQIDSIANSRNIKLGRVVFNKTASDEEADWTLKLSYKFEGEFLVLDDTYYNLNKLLCFIIRKDYFEFAFQKI